MNTGVTKIEINLKEGKKAKHLVALESYQLLMLEVNRTERSIFVCCIMLMRRWIIYLCGKKI